MRKPLLGQKMALVLSLGLVLGVSILVPHPSDASIIYTVNPFEAADSYGLSPFWNWKTIETENFRITFPAELRKVANRSAGFLEEAHSFLSPLLLWTPKNKTQILVIDNQDEA